VGVAGSWAKAAENERLKTMAQMKKTKLFMLPPKKRIGALYQNKARNSTGGRISGSFTAFGLLQGKLTYFWSKNFKASPQPVA
jgi:hypothetical protein